jgi:hypothetical protein
MSSLPRWHSYFASLRGHRISSGCGTSGGRVTCDPEDMRADAEKKLRAMGAWPQDVPLSLAVYTLGRNAASEVGDGSPEEKMALILLAIHRARIWYPTSNAPGGDVNKLLLYAPSMSSETYGYYGPIHGESGVGSAPYGRWAATSADPGLDDLLIAAAALTGNFDEFGHHGDDQIGAQYFGSDSVIGDVQHKAKDHTYWPGDIPGVNPMRLWCYRYRPDVDPNSKLGAVLVKRAVRVLNDPRTRNWTAAWNSAGRPSPATEKYATLPADVPWNDGFMPESSAPATVVAASAISLSAGLSYWLASST